MGFRPNALPVTDDGVPGEIDYRLARQGVLADYRAGRVARHEVCDAHPELRRAAREVGTRTRRTCPICEQERLVLVTYVFGPRLPGHGRCITSARELARLAARRGRFTGYEIEVCPACAWNHLVRAYSLDPTAPDTARRP